MENKQPQSSGFLNGFVIGVLVGVGVALLFTTKKGRRILKALSDEGLEKVSNLDDLMKKFEHVAERAVSGNEEEIIEEDGSDYVPPKKVLLAESLESTPKTVTMPTIQINTTGDEKPEKKERAHEKVEQVEAVSEGKDAVAVAFENLDREVAEIEEIVQKIKPTRRRFFRGIPRRG